MLMLLYKITYDILDVCLWPSFYTFSLMRENVHLFHHRIACQPSEEHQDLGQAKILLVQLIRYDEAQILLKYIYKYILLSLLCFNYDVV